MTSDHYRDCCLRRDPSVGFCAECGTPFIRCMAFAECRTLVTTWQACSACVNLELAVDAGAVVQARKGDRVSLPMILRNASPARRPIWVKRILQRGEGRVYEPMALTWEHLQPGTDRRFTLETPPLDVGGGHTLHLLLVVGSRHKGLEEEYAFAASVGITVSSEPTQSQYNITLTGGTGNLVHMPLTSRPTESAQAPREPLWLKLDRAERYELENGVRGYRDEHMRVPRDVTFTFSGFHRDQCPADHSTLLLTGRLACGRNARQVSNGTDSVANDLCLRVYNGRGAIDEPATLAISRHHFDFVVVNERLCVQARSQHGLQVNKEVLGPGDVAVLTPDDVLLPIPGRGDKLSLHIDFAAVQGTVERVDIRRSPAIA